MAHNLLYLFDRPLEPVFMEKGANKVKFDVPHNLVSDRYAGNPDIIERFGTDSSERIPVRSNISIPNLKVPMSLFIPRHRRIASHLINIFMGLKSVDDLQTVAVYARDRLNPYLFNYAMSVALFHRPDTKDLNLPLLIETFPEKYVDSKVFRQLREEATVVPDGQRMPIIIPRDYTASDLEPEHRLWYFREDIGINLHHWHWHLVYPFEAANNAIVNKDRRGELFYYMHQLMTKIGWGKRVQVELKRELGASFGVCIVGGTVNISNDAQQISGIFIKNIIKSSPAELCKQIKVGDRILAVNEYDVRKATQEQAINLIKNAGSTIKLDIQSFDLSNIPNKTKMNKSVDVNNEKAPYETSTQSNDVQKTTTTKSSDGESSNDDDSEEEDSLGKVLTKAGKEIDRKSAGNVRRSKEEARADDEPENEYGYTDKKIKKRYGNLGNIIRVKINRSNNSMGIALAGHRNRNEMGCFIAGLNPKGAASSANLNIGDEILEINGIVLHKMCHLNASVLIKGIPGAILEFIVLRKDTALDILAVKAVTNFPAAFDQLDHLHSCYKNVRTASIQKNGPSLGIMIIEGKHSELGQGIFISDIQDGSNADKAGLLIGEMILAVNKDLLVDCNYDAAAALLKRAEGIVTLIVCNPNKKDDKKEEILKTPAKAEKKDGTEKAEKPKDEGPPADPSIAKVASNKESIIEINTNNKGLGLFVAGGKMLQPPVDGAYVVYIYPNGAASSDKRLQLFDKIIEVEGKKITADMSYTDLKKVFKRRYLVVTGSPTAFDNRLIVGDMITSINGESVRNASFVDCVLLIKSSQSRLVLKVSRPTNKN